MELNRLNITAFRGAIKPLTIEFDPAKNITMIFGENGNGKTTISDALACLCTNGCGSFDRASVDKAYLPSIGAKVEDVSISLETTSGKFSAFLNARPVGTFRKSPTEGIPTLRPLRRKQIIDLIDEQPSQRYEKLQEYLDVSKVMQCEDELRRLVRSTKSELDKEVKSLADATHTLERAWEDEGKPMDTWEEWAKVESEKDTSKESEKLTQLTDSIRRWQDAGSRYSSIQKQKQTLDQSLKSVQSLEEQMVKAEKAGSGIGVPLLTVLEAAQKFIKDESEQKNCPVCKNSIERDSLLKSMDAEIASMKEIQRINKELVAASKTKESTTAIYNNSLKEFDPIILELCNKLSLFLGSGSSAAKLNASLIEEAKKGNAFVTVSTIYKDLEDLMNKIREKATIIDKTIKQFNLISSNYRGIVASRKKAEHLNTLSQAVEQTNKIVESTRKEFIESALNSVSADIEKMYAQMHPGEGLGDIKLFLKTTGKNSIEISSTFHSEKGVTPQSLYSESHLDTLGICVFLALAKKYSTEDTVLLLDDVMMSVDEAHLDRFIEVLHDVSDNFVHVILTTHYRPWRDRYRNNRADASKVHFLELRQWSKERGITFQNGKNDVDELRRLIADAYFDRQKLASTSGIILENLLDFLTYKFSSRLPRKPKNDYTLRELLDGLSKKLLGLMKVEHLEKDTNGKYSKTSIKKQQELKSLIDSIKDLSMVRNMVGAHFNLEGSLVSDKDVKEFADLTLQLSDLLICPELGSLPDRKPSGSYWETKSGSIRLYPLQEPS